MLSNLRSTFALAGALTSVTLFSLAGGCSSGTTGSFTPVEAGISCGAGSVECNGTCTVVARDPENCGACGKKCGAGEVCSAGACASSCGSTTSKCGSECVDTKSDPRNCGGCGTKCTAGQVCNAGSCAADCGALAKCGSSCVDTQTDRTNCGGCGTVCGTGELCVAGKCDLSCPPNMTKCTPNGDAGVSDASVEAGDGGSSTSAYCAATQSDNLNCGGCGTVCGNGKTCVAGQCQSIACSGGQTLCTPDGGAPYCATTQTDNSNCGTCGKACAGAQKCVAGVCTTSKIDVLICTGDATASNNNDVQAKLVATGAFGKVDLMACNNVTPTLLQLQAYSSVLVISNNTFANPAGLGDVLADYADAGGYVVVSAFAYASGYALAGRWISGGYNLMTVGTYSAFAESAAVQIVDPTSTLIVGVTTLTGTGIYRHTSAVANGGVVVARYGTTTQPLIIKGLKNGRVRVDVNMFPPSNAAVSGYWIGDGATILKNALLYR